MPHTLVHPLSEAGTQLGLVRGTCLAGAAASVNGGAILDHGSGGEVRSQTTIARLQQAGVTVESTFSVLSQVHDTWNEENTPLMAEAYSAVAPAYRLVLQSSFAQPES